MTIYCPACGEYSEIEIEFMLSPGHETNVICPNCETVFLVEISFKEIQEGIK